VCVCVCVCVSVCLSVCLSVGTRVKMLVLWRKVKRDVYFCTTLFAKIASCAKGKRFFIVIFFNVMGTCRFRRNCHQQFIIIDAYSRNL